MRALLPTAVLALLAACAGDDGPPPRELVIEATVGADGLSAPISFEVPEQTRSLTVVVEGATTSLYALGQLTTADGVDQVGLPAGSPAAAMRASYNDEQIGQMPGGLFQSIRLGTFTQVFPDQPGVAVLPGATTIRVAGDGAGPVTVRILMPPDDGSLALHVNLIVLSDTLSVASPPSFVDEVQGIFDQASIAVVIDQVVTIPGTAFENLTESTEPQEAPGSMSAMLPGLVRDRLAGPALDVFVVESLPAGIGGLSLGTPGPPIRGGYYYGVIIRGSAGDTTMARVIAHEVCHFLALQHVQNRGVSGQIYPDPLDDTTPGQNNLMESGTILTAGQAFALSRSSLLRPL